MGREEERIVGNKIGHKIKGLDENEWSVGTRSSFNETRKECHVSYKVETENCISFGDIIGTVIQWMGLYIWQAVHTAFAD